MKVDLVDTRHGNPIFQVRDSMMNDNKKQYLAITKMYYVFDYKIYTTRSITETTQT